MQWGWGLRASCPRAVLGTMCSGLESDLEMKGTFDTRTETRCDLVA